MSMAAAEEETAPVTADRARVVVSWLGILLLLCVVVGALVSLFWTSVVILPTWHVQSDGAATMAESGWTAMISIDAWYVICAVLVGPGLGYVAWRWFKPLGWPAALICAFAGLVTGWLCAELGPVVGPGPFAERIAAATPGTDVPVAFGLQAWSALAVWPLAAVAPALFASVLGPDPEDHHRRRENQAPAGDPGDQAVRDAEQAGGSQPDVAASSGVRPENGAY